MPRTMLWSLATVTIFAIAAGSAVPADAAKKRNKATDGNRPSKYSDSVDLSYVAGHGSPSSISLQKRARPRGLRAR